jgi:hypothetical protein
MERTPGNHLSFSGNRASNGPGARDATAPGKGVTDVTVTSDQERRGAEQWFRRRGLPAVVRGRSGQIVVRTLPAVVWMTLLDLLYDLLAFLDGDAEFETRLESDTFVLLYTSVLIGYVVLPAAGVWLAARQTRRWVLRAAGFLPACLLTACYVLVEPAVDHWLQKENFLLSVADNLFFFGLLCALTATGLGAIFGWALRAALRQLRGIGMMTSRSLPLLLLVTTFGFFTAELWQSAGALRNQRIWLVVGFFGVVGALFLISVLSAELQTVAALSESTDHAGQAAEYPFHAPEPAEPTPSPPLTRAERANMVFILLLTQALQAMVFGLLVCVLFVTLGWLAVPRKVMSAWAGHEVTQGTLFGVQIPIASELLHVCVLIAAFSGLYFIVTVVTDAAHRSTFYEPVLAHLRVSLTARAAYLTRFAPRASEVSA